MMYSQIWLNLLMDDHHFGYIEGNKNLVTYYATQSHVLSNCELLSSHHPRFNSAWDDKPNCDKTTPKRHQKTTQNAHKLLCGSRKSKKPNPPPILGGRAGCGGGITTTYRVLTQLLAYEWDMHKMASKKLWATSLGKTSKKNKVGWRKGKEAALLLLLPTWDLYTCYEKSGELPPEFASTTKIFDRYIFPGLKKPFLT
jgi:hypothetical protein